jgi:flagellar motor switch protein FliM
MTNISAQDFLKIKKGDVIVLDKRIEEPLVIEIENIPKFIGYPGKINNQVAVKLISEIPLGKEGYYE